MSEYTPTTITAGEMERIAEGLQHRMGELLNIDPFHDPTLAHAVHDSRIGRWGTVYGAYGAFNGNNQVPSDRKAIDDYFTGLKYNVDVRTGHAVRETIASFAGKTVEEDAFNAPDGTIRNNLLATRSRFALDTPATDTSDARRTLWIPMVDHAGPVPLWRRVSGPAEHVKAEETVLLAGDHVIEPNLGGWYGQAPQVPTEQ